MEHIEGRQPVLEALRAGRRRGRAGFFPEALRDRAPGAPLAAAAKAAAGALEHISVCVVAGIPAALDELRRHGLWLVGLDAGGPSVVWDEALFSEPVALVVGSEGSGLGRLVRDRLDQIVRIPLFGAVGSLNA